MAIGRLPQTVGIRLILLAPSAICMTIFVFTGSLIALLVLALYYVMIGYSLARFICASYTNGVFDKFINSRIEGAKVNQGLRKPDDEDGEDEETEADGKDKES